MLFLLSSPCLWPRSRVSASTRMWIERNDGDFLYLSRNSTSSLGTLFSGRRRPKVSQRVALLTTALALRDRPSAVRTPTARGGPDGDDDHDADAAGEEELEEELELVVSMPVTRHPYSITPPLSSIPSASSSASTPVPPTG